VCADGRALDIRGVLGEDLHARLGSIPAAVSRPHADREAVAAISFTSGSTGVPRANIKTWGMLADGTKINATAMFEGSPPGMSLEQPPSVERVFSATAPLDERLAEQAEQAFGGELLEIYGCSEVGSIACKRSAHETSWRVFDGLELVEATAIDGSTGDFRIAAEHLSEIAELQDRLKLTAPNRFRLLGRREDLLNIAGKRGSLAEINRRLLAIDGVIDGVAFQPADARLAAVVVAPDLNRRDVLDALRQSLDPVFLPRPLVFVECLPRQASSKLRKRDLLALLEGQGAEAPRSDASGSQASG